MRVGRPRRKSWKSERSCSTPKQKGICSALHADACYRRLSWTARRPAARKTRRRETRKTTTTGTPMCVRTEVVWRDRWRLALPAASKSSVYSSLFRPTAKRTNGSRGGSGYLPRVAEGFHHVAKRAIEHLDHRDCETACYRCLKSYQNQRYHENLAWPQTIPVLEELAQSPPTPRSLETGDIDDPRPWLEAYSAGVGSPLELKFLRLFEKHGFNPQKQIAVAPSADELTISVADFAVPDRRLAIYIDGAAFHVGDRLRRDRFIRDRLRNGDPPWRVEELRAPDLAQGVALVERLKNHD